MKKESSKNPMKTFLDTYIKLKKIFFKWGHDWNQKNITMKAFSNVYFIPPTAHTRPYAL